jgi:hypothetical protein
VPSTRDIPNEFVYAAVNYQRISFKLKRFPAIFRSIAGSFLEGISALDMAAP